MEHLPLLPPLVSALFSLAVGVFALARGFGRPVHVVLSGIGLSAFLYNLAQLLFWVSPSVWWTRLGWIGALALIPLLAEFPDSVLEERFARARTRRLAMICFVIFLAILPTDLLLHSSLQRFGDSLVAVSGPAMPVYVLVMAVLLFRIAWRLIRVWRSTTDELLHRRVEFLLLGQAFYCLCAAHDQLLRAQVFWVFSFPIIDWATLGFMLIVVYATMRFRLIDIDLVLSVGIYYLLLTFGTALLYFSMENLLENQLGGVIPLQSWWAVFLPALSVAVFIGPIHGLIQRLIDRIFLPPGWRGMRLFRSPNFQFLALDRRTGELDRLQAELGQVLREIRDGGKEAPPADPGPRKEG